MAPTRLIVLPAAIAATVVVVGAALAAPPVLAQARLDPAASQVDGSAPTDGQTAPPGSAPRPLNAPPTDSELRDLDEAELARRAALDAARKHGWFVQPLLGFRVSATDNAPLAASGGRSADLLTTVTAGLSVYVREPRLKADGTMTFESDDYLAHRGTSRLLSDGGLDATWDAIAHHLFLEAAVVSTRTTNNPFALAPGSGTTANTNSLTQGRLTPFLDGELSGGIFHYLIRSENGWTPPTSGTVTFADRPATYANRDTAEFEMRPQPLGAAVMLERDQSRYGAPVDTRLTEEAVRMIPRYRFGPTLAVGARLGYQRNDYALQEVDRRRRILGADLDWTPDLRTRLHGYGESRAFGPAWQAELRTRSTFLAVIASGSRETTTSAQSMFRVNAVSDVQTLVDAVYTARFPDPAERSRVVQQIVGGLGLNPGDLHAAIGLYTPNLARTSQFSATAIFLTQRDIVSWSLYGLNNEILQLSTAQPLLAQFALGSYDDLGTALTLTHRLQRRLSLTLKSAFDRTRGLGAADTARSVQRRFTLQVNRSFSHRLDGVAGLLHQSITSTVVPGVTEDELFAGIVFRP